MTVSIIVAMSENRVIGKGNQLPWHIPEDLKYFQDKTKGCPVIMGRKTFESMDSRPLPNRKNIVVSRDKSLEQKGVIVVSSLDEGIATAEGQGEIFVIGGSGIYEEGLKKVDKVYLTIVHKEFEGDAFFPEVDLSKDFAHVSKGEKKGTDPQYSFHIYYRK